MPSYGLPSVLYNVVCAFNEKLPATARSSFHDLFFKRLELIPHPEQERYDTSETFEMCPMMPGTNHLDGITKWFLLGLLLDPNFGVIELTSVPEEQARMRRVGRLLVRWLQGDYPSEPEWEALPNAEEESTMSTACLTAVWLQPLGGDGGTMVTPVLDMAACSGWHPRMRRPPRCPLVSPSFIGRGFDRGLNWLARKLGRAGPLPPGLLTHYYWQATWLLDLMSLHWLPTDPREEALFKRIVAGSLDEMPAYIKMLTKQKVELELARAMEATLRRMDALRQRVDTKTKR